MTLLQTLERAREVLWMAAHHAPRGSAVKDAILAARDAVAEQVDRLRSEEIVEEMKGGHVKYLAGKDVDFPPRDIPDSGEMRAILRVITGEEQKP